MARWHILNSATLPLCNSAAFYAPRRVFQMTFGVNFWPASRVWLRKNFVAVQRRKMAIAADPPRLISHCQEGTAVNASRMGIVIGAVTGIRLNQVASVPLGAVMMMPLNHMGNKVGSMRKKVYCDPSLTLGTTAPNPAKRLAYTRYPAMKWRMTRIHMPVVSVGRVRFPNKASPR